MAIIQDVFSIFKKRDLLFIKRIQETENIYTFLFEKAEDNIWKAGQHGLFTITHQKIKDHTRAFSIASAPNEDVIQVTMRVSDAPSDFKKSMLGLKQGDSIKMAGPVGPFYLKEKQPTILVAGGIGITPFRSVLKQLETEGTGKKHDIHLLYSDSNKDFVFREELENISEKTSISIAYIETKKQLQQELATLATLYSNNGKYLIAGPKSMVNDMATYLQKQTISKKNIIKDILIGY
ncbi:Ferredoxin-NADP reductase [Gracilibacillus kekensis]|uniref:Ferredoxin-NADP reductase n=1 Tax=Gracilibacillus kekensis TaxID=1027249 RepID=A0A1M7QGG9_9BACI|nr:FAD-dependent oxidoreductase [Gracilibacillus kekensis]SHN30100.1 Ferredoxin-NADP reductase [Gracilibacillus kekensis]